MKHGLLTALLLIAMLSTSHIHIIQAQSSWEYGYLVTGEDRILLRIVRSDERADSQSDVAPQFLSVNFVFQAVPSPDGRLIALLGGTDRPDTQIIYVWNNQTGDLREVAQGYVHYNREYNEYSLHWSPNSRYLGMVVNQGSGGELLVYDSDINSTSNFMQDDTHQQYFAWSHDSSQIAISTWQSIDMGAETRAKLQAFDVETRVTTRSFDLKDVPSPLQTPVCNLQWSPDNRFVSFQSACEIPSSASPREIFIWDVGNNTIHAVTNMTTDAFLTTSGVLIQGSYDMTWQTSEDLIVTSRIFLQSEEPASQTIAYNTTTRTTQVIAPVTLVNLTSNPVSNALAFGVLPEEDHTVTTSNQHPIQLISSVEMASVIEGVATLTNLSRTIEATGGCDLTWSPDGQTLAYTIRAEGNCRAPIEAILLVNSETAVVQLFDILPEDVGHVIPLGWLAR